MDHHLQENQSEAVNSTTSNSEGALRNLILKPPRTTKEETKVKTSKIWLVTTFHECDPYVRNRRNPIDLVDRREIQLSTPNDKITGELTNHKGIHFWLTQMEVCPTSGKHHCHIFIVLKRSEDWFAKLTQIYTGEVQPVRCAKSMAYYVTKDARVREPWASRNIGQDEIDEIKGKWESEGCDQKSAIKKAEFKEKKHGERTAKSIEEKVVTNVESELIAGKTWKELRAINEKCKQYYKMDMYKRMPNEFEPSGPALPPGFRGE